MSATLLPVTTLSSVYPTAADLVVFTAADVPNGNSYLATGREVLHVRNVGAGNGTLVVSGAPDRQGRTANLSQVVAAGTTRALMLAVAGWRQTDGTRLVLLSGDTADLHFAVVRLPQ